MENARLAAGPNFTIYRNMMADQTADSQVCCLAPYLCYRGEPGRGGRESPARTDWAGSTAAVQLVAARQSFVDSQIRTSKTHTSTTAPAIPNPTTSPMRETRLVWGCDLWVVPSGAVGN